ncbi:MULTISPECIES: hypothetical protein [unclassified Acidovorax]|uniref:hypothetical protein n=1 Tax=unclassified Acidovorax TaxID=2684926 RepID=UPI001C468B73|nr:MULTISPECIES: hypothetical protein [unclassified Acidovorax]
MDFHPEMRERCRHGNGNLFEINDFQGWRRVAHALLDGHSLIGSSIAEMDAV